MRTRLRKKIYNRLRNNRYHRHGALKARWDTWNWGPPIPSGHEYTRRWRHRAQR